mgnify:CR=1 FL=1
MTFLKGKELRKNRSRTKIKVRNKSNRSIVAVKRTNKNIYVYLKSLEGAVIESFSSKLISDSDRKKLSGLKHKTFKMIIYSKKFSWSSKNFTRERKRGMLRRINGRMDLTKALKIIKLQMLSKPLQMVSST